VNGDPVHVKRIGTLARNSRVGVVDQDRKQDPQPAWAVVADGNGRIPTFFRSSGTEAFARDYLKCDLVVHTQDDASGSGNGQATLTWTAAADGIVSIDGTVWQVRDIGRSNDWKLLKNDVLLTQGSLASGDIYSRSSPFLFKNGSGARRRSPASRSRRATR